MRKTIASAIEGAIVGISIAVIVRILDIEVTSIQLIILIFIAFFSASIASAIGRFIAKGENPLRHEWVYKYGENRIEVTTGLTEKLYINDELVFTNKKVSLKLAELKGKLKTGEEVVATITPGGDTGIKCRLLVGNEELQVIVVKGDTKEI
jgi:hypothetical protein